MLQKTMEAERFSRVITVSNANKTAYYLPTAEYNRTGQDLTRAQILHDAEKAATKMGKTFLVLVTRADGRTGYNSPAVKS